MGSELAAQGGRTSLADRLTTLYIAQTLTFRAEGADFVVSFVGCQAVRQLVEPQRFFLALDGQIGETRQHPRLHLVVVRFVAFRVGLSIFETAVLLTKRFRNNLSMPVQLL